MAHGSHKRAAVGSRRTDGVFFSNSRQEHAAPHDARELQESPRHTRDAGRRQAQRAPRRPRTASHRSRPVLISEWSRGDRTFTSLRITRELRARLRSPLTSRERAVAYVAVILFGVGLSVIYWYRGTA